MSAPTTASPTPGKLPAPQRHIDLEHVYGELQVVPVSIKATEHLICELQSLLPDTDEQEARAVLEIDIMLMEIKRVVTSVFNDLSEFIDASSAANLYVGKPS